jgi:lambda repressor-like predicted transcriptional regulator
MSNPLHPLAEVVGAALGAAGISQNAASIQSGIPRETLRRRLVTGDFKYGELCRIAEVLNTTPGALATEAQERAA